MVAPATKQKSLLTHYDRRRFQRVMVNLLGRFMLEDRQEYPCQTSDISPGSCALITPVVARVGEHVVAYVDHIGRLEGTVSRLFDGGFAVTLACTARKKDKLAAKLTWLANRHALNLPEDRRHERIAPENPNVEIKLPDGRLFQGRIIDLSLSGAALTLPFKPPPGAPIMIGKIRAQVARHFEEGIGIEFDAEQKLETIQNYLH